MEKKSVTEILQLHGKYVTPIRGTSMTPLLREAQDMAVIKPAKFPLARFEVPLYVRADGTHVLHRVLGKDARGYILCGDNQLRLEHGVREEMIQGVMAGFFRGERYVPVEDWRYRLYVFCWCRSLFLRRIFLWLKRNMRRKGA